MATLWNKTQNKAILQNLEIADNFWTRAVGLLGKKALDENQGLWIHDGNSIHTFFMRFAIDCVFLDKNLKVCAVKKNISPFRVTWPVWKAQSVIELPAGWVEKNQALSLGDELHVGA